MNEDVRNITLALRKCKPKAGITEAITLFNGGYNAEEYELGDFKKDYEGAVKCYRFAAKAELPEAQNNLGWMYANGRGVEKDFLRAYMWFHLSAEQGLAEGKANCAIIEQNNLLNPDGVAKAKSMAKECRDSNYEDC